MGHGPVYMRTRGAIRRGCSAIAAPTAMHQGRKKMTREASASGAGSGRPGGAQGELGGAGACVHVIMDAG